MKKAFLILLLVFAKQLVFAQKDSCYAGVYVTKDDLINNNLSHKINTERQGYKVKFPAIADWKLEIKIVTPENTYKYPEGTVFGYYECGTAYRYWAGGKLYAVEDFYRIEDRGPLIIYTPVYNSGDEHYYSTGLSAPIRRLNMKNLKEDFYDQSDFIRRVKKLKNKGVHGGLAMPGAKGKFLINEIYSETVKK